ncbi:hypothetical protein JZ751_000763 [Albula glossodonta]|uniref:Retinoic acid receptor responder protein 2 n=1 Tax=Albula glossodonta TaxID=121402 RepID=A0A8T2PWZ9_9TELE|nr:hypothetical protein JZ751_000763 [Albula glossodonta]
MSRLQLLLLLTAGAFVSSAEAQAAYDQLPDDFKIGVDLALEQLRSHASIRHHFLFFKSLSKTKTETSFSVNYIYHNFYFKPTKCAKGTTDASPKRCPFRNDRSGYDVSYIYHNFYLKPTKCSKDTVDPNPKQCPFRNDRPLIDCAVCYKTFSGNIESEPKPYVNCVHKPALTEDMKTKRVEHCNKMAYSSGAVTLLGSTGKN